MTRFVPGLGGIDRRRRSPNFGPRVSGFAAPAFLVLHYTGMRDGPAAIDRLCDPASQVSCHYVVTEAGAILELVPEEHRAWCCGRASWRGITDLNSASVSIEIVNGGHDYGLPPYLEAQIASVIRLGRDIAERHALRPEQVLAHSDIAPGRKQDPGEHFAWPRLAAAGLGAWSGDAPPTGRDLLPGTSGAAVAQLQADLGRYGYGIAASGDYDAATVIVVEAFQRHFRPERVDGIADRETLGRLAGLLAKLPGAETSQTSV